MNQCVRNFEDETDRIYFFYFTKNINNIEIGGLGRQYQICISRASSFANSSLQLKNVSLPTNNMYNLEMRTILSVNIRWQYIQIIFNFNLNKSLGNNWDMFFIICHLSIYDKIYHGSWYQPALLVEIRTYLSIVYVLQLSLLAKARTLATIKKKGVIGRSRKVTS